MAAKYGCPADSVSLGKGSWRLLHTMGVYYPEKPTEDVKEDMTKFIGLFSKFYPCPPCAEDFRQWYLPLICFIALYIMLGGIYTDNKTFILRVLFCLMRLLLIFIQDKKEPPRRFLEGNTFTVVLQCS